MSDEDRFADSPVSRRRFFQLSAAVGASLALPGNATASASDEAFTAGYQYVLNHTPEDHAVPTLVTFSSEAGVAAFEALGVGEATHTTTTPTAAAYGQLTTAQAQQVADLPEADEFQFAPGSNPFWRIGYYPLGVFPEPRRSVDYIGFEQLKDGLAELESRYPDRVRVKDVGQSPGHTNNVTDRPDPKGMYVAELTNFDSETAFEDKEKVFFSCSLHGLEMAGRETGARVLENAARGSEPDVPGSDAKLEPLLDDVVVIIGFVNPDGWAVRNPQYDSGWQTSGPGALGPRVPAAPLYERGNAEVFDTNRQYPVVGYIDPVHYPAAPANYEGEEPSFVNEKVPDAKALVDFFQGYENLNYGADLHGGPVFNNFVLGLISQDQFNTRELHEVYEMCLNIDETLAEALDTWETVGQARVDLVGDQQFDPLLFGVVPESAFDYATIYDTIAYTVSGAFLDWMAHPEPIGLDMTTLDFEMSFNHILGGNVYNPELFEMEVTGYRAAIRTITEFAVNNSETPTTSENFSTRTETGGDRVAYITTGEVGTGADALRRTHEQLSFDAQTEFYETTEETTVSADVTELTFDVTGADAHSMGVHLHGHGLLADLELVAPDGEVVRSFEGVTEERVGGKCCGLPEFTVSEPGAGTWTLRVDSYGEAAQAVEMQQWTLAAQGNPDPTSVDNWGGEGYEQSAYDVTPFTFFEDYQSAEKRGIVRNFIQDDGSLEPVTVDEVRAGALDDYDHAVLIHDYVSPSERISEGVSGNAKAGVTEGVTDDAYTGALDEFLDDGGNLVVTDTGTYVLPELDNELVDGSAISPGENVERQFLDVARFTSKNLDHPLFDDSVREIQEQLWKVQPLGYQVSGSAPMDLLDEGAFAAAANDCVASVAGRTNGLVAAGSITPDETTDTGVHYVSSLLPPATQANLHPFGLQNYTLTFLGYILFTSALGFEQVRDTGETTRRYGRTREWEVDGIEAGPGVSISADGSRSDDGSVFTGGQTNRVEITVETIEGDVSSDASVTITDEIPDGWTVDPSYGDVEGVENGVVDLGTVTPGDVEEGSVIRSYFAEAPEGAAETGRDTFGPATATVTIGDETVSDEVAGTDTNTVVGPSTEL